MTIETVDIPQADVLWDVARVPEAVLHGATTPDAIGVSIGAKGPRQGLYYTQAARILGLVQDVSSSGSAVFLSKPVIELITNLCRRRLLAMLYSGP